MKLWQKDYSLNKEIEKFTVGNDYLLDVKLVKYDVFGSIAHAIMLSRMGVLENGELKKLKAGLSEIYGLSEKGKFQINVEDEDVHTAIENYLTKKLGNLGKKIHTARSRNDQILVDLRLYSKENILSVEKSLLKLISSIIGFAEKNNNVPIPGYTHSRKAMPSSVGLLFGAYAESLLDDFELLETAYKLNNQNPLGSVTGYGVNMDIDRQLTTQLLDFDKIQNNTLYAQNSRGKVESTIIFALSRIMNGLARMSNDLIIFSMEEFKFFSLPNEFTTGSSIMPNKKNPDVLELLRSKSSIVESNLFKIDLMLSKLPSGYNRDFQLSKEPLMESFETTQSSINIMNIVVSRLEVNKEKCISSFTNEIFATDEVIELVKEGKTMRDAYKEVASNLDSVEKINPVGNILSKKHIGATGNLGLNKLKKQLGELDNKINLESKKFNSIKKLLLK